MNIAIGSDHGGYKLKQTLAKFLKQQKSKVLDVGSYSEERCDYPDFAKAVVRLIKTKKAKYGILICKSGLGMSMSANRYKGIRAALCTNLKMAELSRQHNNANILVFGASFTTPALAKKMCKIFLSTEFLGERHAKRINKIDK